MSILNYERCERDVSWVGRCNNIAVNVTDNPIDYEPGRAALCSKHLKDRCACGKPAIRDCENAGSLVCGRPLCANCKCTAHGRSGFAPY